MILAWYYYCMKYNPFRQSLGSSTLLRVHESGGASATINKLAPQKNFRAKPEKQKGKKERGLGEGIFALLLAEAKRRRAETLGGIQSSASGFSLKKVRISSKTRSRLVRCSGRPSRIKSPFRRFFDRISL